MTFQGVRELQQESRAVVQTFEAAEQNVKVLNTFQVQLQAVGGARRESDARQLQTLLQRVRVSTQNEVLSVRTLLHRVRHIMANSKHLKKMRAKKIEPAPVAVRCPPQPYPPGTTLAVHKEQLDGSSLVLVTVLRYLSARKMYDVEDVADEDGKHERMSVAAENCVPLFHREPAFPRGAKVLAVFHNTTAFYPAVVVTPPTRANPTEYYLAFADDSEQNDPQLQLVRKVASHFVIEDASA